MPEGRKLPPFGHVGKVLGRARRYPYSLAIISAGLVRMMLWMFRATIATMSAMMMRAPMRQGISGETSAPVAMMKRVFFVGNINR